MPFVSHVLRIQDFCENAREPFFPKLSLHEVVLDKEKNRLVSTVLSELPKRVEAKSLADHALRARSEFTDLDRLKMLGVALTALVSRENQFFRTKVSCKNSRPVKTNKWVQAHEIHLPLPKNADHVEIEKQLKKLKGINFKIVVV